jgi:hypothetical protein
MAKETIVRLIDDVDGTTAETTVQFTWSGVAYEIDVSSKNARAFEAAVEPYVKAATRITAGRKQLAKKATPHLPKLDLAAIREWAVANGHKVASRGRIPAIVIDAYHAAQRPLADRAAPAPARKAPARKATAKKTAAKKAAPRKTAPRKAAAKKSTK